jgi:hypothetical protein
LARLPEVVVELKVFSAVGGVDRVVELDVESP